MLKDLLNRLEEAEFFNKKNYYENLRKEVGSNGDIRLSERIPSSNNPTYKIGDKVLFSIKKIEKNK